MSEEHNNVAEEIAAEEVVNPEVSSSDEKNSIASEAESQQSIDSDKELNFRKLREAKEQLEKENRELRSYYEKLNVQNGSIESSANDFDIADDELVEGKVLKKIYNELNSLKKNYEEEKSSQIPDRLKTKFSDFNEVVTRENIDKLKESEPELYASITSGNDLYAKGVSAYKTLKALGIAKSDHYQEQKKQVQENQSRPVSTQSIKGQSALSDANIFAKGLTPELKRQLQEEMRNASKAL